MHQELTETLFCSQIIGCQVRREPPNSTERYTRWINQLAPGQLLTQVLVAQTGRRPHSLGRRRLRWQPGLVHPLALFAHAQGVPALTGEGGAFQRSQRAGAWEWGRAAQRGTGWSAGVCLGRAKLWAGGGWCQRDTLPGQGLEAEVQHLGGAALQGVRSGSELPRGLG